jgi:tripartite-type tricarboxylate transporter receptor subunit TctC
MLGAAMTSRRKILQWSVACAAAAALVSALAGIGQAVAQDYPNRPVRWIVGFAAGGPNDILARFMGQHLAERLGQPFVIETRTGAGGNLATQAVVSAPPDGHTLLNIGHFNAMNTALYPKAPFDFVRDIVPIAGISQAPNVLLISPSLAVNSVPELIAYMKAHPNKLSFGSSGNGTSSHLSGELFKAMTGTSMQHVPYRGTGPVMIDLMSGQVQVYFTSTVGLLQHIQEGKVRALAVTGARRFDALPDVPAIAEAVPGFEVLTWLGVGAPKATPAAIVARLNREINAGLADPKIRARLGELGGTPDAATPEQLMARIVAETEQWGRVVKASGAKLD